MRQGKTVRIPESTADIIKARYGQDFAYNVLCLLHQALELPPPATPSERKAAGGKAVTGSAKNPRKNK